MSEKVVVIIASGEKEKALTGLMYAKNAIMQNWLENVKVIFFGPAEHLIVEDAEVSSAVEKIVELSDCLACKAISEREELTGSIAQRGVEVKYVGSIISELIKDGYVPMVW